LPRFGEAIARSAEIARELSFRSKSVSWLAYLGVPGRAHTDELFTRTDQRSSPQALPHSVRCGVGENRERTRAH